MTKVIFRKFANGTVVGIFTQHMVRSRVTKLPYVDLKCVEPRRYKAMTLQEYHKTAPADRDESAKLRDIIQSQEPDRISVGYDLSGSDIARMRIPNTGITYDLYLVRLRDSNGETCSSLVHASDAQDAVALVAKDMKDAKGPAHVHVIPGHETRYRVVLPWEPAEQIEIPK
jgi:hypothetical protein